MAERAAPQTKAPAKTPSLTKTTKPAIRMKCNCGGSCAACKDDNKKDILQRKGSVPATSGMATAPSIVGTVLSSPGRPLDAPVRNTMESRFGTDFSNVRIHTDSRAAESARAVGAQAYTFGPNIVFDHGRYNPSVPTGQKLLAHELAHTIQQGGLQQMANDAPEVGLASDPLEYEADRAAEMVTAGYAAPSLTQGDFGAIRRTEDGTTPVAPPSPVPPTSATTTPVTGTTPPPSTPGVPAPIPGTTALAGFPPELDATKLNQAGVTQILDTDPPGGIHRTFVIQYFDLPAAKGPFSKAIYDAMATSNQLRATIDMRSANPSAGASQARDRTSTLRRSWLQRVNWSEQRANTYWAAVGGKTQTGRWTSKLQNDTICDMDHIVELQLGGGNQPTNVQLLDPTPNRSSGSNIFLWLVERATLIRDAYPAGAAPGQITMAFRQVRVPEGETSCGTFTDPASQCLAIECRLANGPVAGAEGQEDPAGKTRLRVNSGAANADVWINPTGTTDLNEPIFQNRGFRQLVPGFLMDSYVKGTPADTVRAKMDTGRLSGRGGTSSIPINIDVTKHPNPQFRATDAGEVNGVPTRTLAFLNMTDPVMNFHYPFLSQGNLRLAYAEDGSISGTGTLRPSLPLFRNTQFGLTFGNGTLTATLGANVSTWRPFGPARVTRAELSATLLPELSAQGNLDFAIGGGSSPIATANINVTANMRGFEASGTINLHVPRIDNAQGRIVYRDGAWSGSIRITSTQLQIPNVTSCTVVVDFTNQGIRPSGEIVIDVRGNPITLRAAMEGNNWVFSGSGRFTYPPLNPTTLSFRYTRGRLTATGTTGFTFRGLTGTITINYDEGVVTGEGTLNMTRGRMNGTITARLLRSGAITADGTISYQLTPSLRAQVGISIDERQNVRLTGELRFTQPIELFRRFGSERRLFSTSVDIPILGISLGPVSVGLVFRITGSLSVDYGIGPGRIEDLHLSAGFNPFDENPNFELEGGGRLVIPIGGGFTASIRGALALSAGIASISGGLTASARVGLNGGFTNNLTISYRQGKYTVDNIARLTVAPELSFGLEANVEAEALRGAYTYHRGYQLASYRFGSNLEFGVEAPFHYESDQPFRPPSLDSIRFIKPDIDVSSLMSGMLSRVGAA
ncbi:MAG: DUF4157 domain-containing protein [Fimbriimonadaceae bacterium]|nr:DUF4157 domain-containing protein [Fimbriimonadaceae bacterium]